MSGHLTTMFGAIFARSLPSRDHAFGVRRDDLGAHRARYELADLFQDLAVGSGLFGEKAGVRGDAVHEAKGSRFANFVHIGGIQEKLHLRFLQDISNYISKSAREPHFGQLAPLGFVRRPGVVDGRDRIVVGLARRHRIIGKARYAQDVLGEQDERTVLGVGTIDAIAGDVGPLHFGPREQHVLSRANRDQTRRCRWREGIGRNQTNLRRRHAFDARRVLEGGTTGTMTLGASSSSGSGSGSGGGSPSTAS